MATRKSRTYSFRMTDFEKINEIQLKVNTAGFKVKELKRSKEGITVYIEPIFIPIVDDDAQPS